MLNLDKILKKLIHSRLSTFLNVKDIIYPLQNSSTSYALIHLAEVIKEALDQFKYVCGIFVDLQKVFDTVEHNTPLGKLKLYGIRGVVCSRFESYLKDRKQYISINGYNSNIRPRLFLICINDLNTAIKHHKVQHFADDTNLLHINDSIKKLNKAVNSNLRNLTDQLNIDKISLNVSKTELVLFKLKMKKLDFDLKLKLNGQIVYPIKSIEYLGIKIDEKLTCTDHINDITIKLNPIV